ncbi:hypothetical protein PHLGIDRAFT_126414 [Phlebiopsis gigantea 11061_1 CR5-6]|uniref:Cytochrome b561 domain-containing protein n=1 Tax=Phlebiopsis gigantea (strain 11061_1 CR5-6) TaxID=745531 RepID=A0A0C3SAJ3_PHLG1|nr:hypothetical protein PHLGIDRAFT_126414 [Phlebiopsis gigantea 11061_1 CR5-6]
MSQPARFATWFGRTSSQPLADEGVSNSAEELQALTANEESLQQDSEDMSFQEQFQPAEGRSGDAIAQVVAVASVATLLVTTWIAVFASGASFYWFAWHPLLQSAAVALFTYGILTLQPASYAKSKAAGLTRHQLAMAVTGFPVAFLGYAAMFFNKILASRAHFTTWHGTFGLITFILMTVQLILGGGSVWLNGALFGGNPKAKLVWKYHRAVGYLTLFFFMLTFHLGGAWSSWATEHTWWIARLLAFTLAPVGVLVAVYSRIRPSKMKFW